MALNEISETQGNIRVKLTAESSTCNDKRPFTANQSCYLIISAREEIKFIHFNISSLLPERAAVIYAGMASESFASFGQKNINIVEY